MEARTLPQRLKALPDEAGFFARRGYERPVPG